ncbi:MAG TPA: MFS transporter [Acidimicrobiales bacterium]|jgi:EmrB/QacA subfamily drug resistance transporter|nr:MFS transporter [Acidimicrobiales bacterium]
MDSSVEARQDYRLTYAVLVVGVTAYALLQSLVIPVLPTIQSALHTSQSNAAWVLTMYLLSASIFTPIVGRLGDLWGKKRLLVITLVGLAAGCAISALSQTLLVMLIGRAVQGIGGGLMPLAFGIVRDEFPKAKVPGAVGTTAAIVSAGSGAGLVLAGPIVSAASFRWLFWIPLICLVVAAVAAFFVVPDSAPRTGSRVRWSGAALLSGWLVLLLVPLSEASQWGWGSATTIGMLLAAAVVAALWVKVESASDHPMIDMRLMRVPVVWTSNLVAFLFGVGMYANFAFLPQFLQTPKSAGYGFGLSVTQSGLILLPSTVMMFLGGLATGRLTLRYGGRAVLIVGAVVSIVPFIMLATSRSQLWELALAMTLFGAGFGLVYSAMTTLIVEGVRMDETGVASGMNANIRTIGGSIGAAVMASAVTATSHGGGLPTNAGYTHGYLLLLVAAVAAGGAGFLVPGRLRPPTARQLADALPHPELGMVAGGTLLGDLPE